MAGVFDFNLSDDALGFGKMVAGASAARHQGTDQCGSKPTCTLKTAGCNRQWDSYNACTAAAIQANIDIANAQARTPAPGATSSPISLKTIAIIGGVLLVLVLIIRR